MRFENDDDAPSPTDNRDDASGMRGGRGVSDGNYDGLSRDELIRLLRERESGSVRIAYKGQTPPWQIVRKVKPRGQVIEQDWCAGPEEAQAANCIIEGENLQAMVSLYKYRGQIDLVLTDPPYNTGGDFRYNDRWDTNPNDEGLGEFVAADDAWRHTKWLRFMAPRLWMIREMLSASGVLAICIDHRELFQLGMLLDGIFGEKNRIGIINWQKTFSPKATHHLSTATEYVLVYAKSVDKATTALLPRDEKSDRFFADHDQDPDGDWAGKDPTAREPRKGADFGIQSPFTGMLHYPEAEYRFDGSPPQVNMHWRGIDKKGMQRCLNEWGTRYQEVDIGDGRSKALILVGAKICMTGYDPMNDPVVTKAKKKALRRLGEMNWPEFYFRDDRAGNTAAGRPRLKAHEKHAKRGKVALTYWADEDYDTPFVLGTQSWNHPESGHSKAGADELEAMLGRQNFTGVKPLRLFKKIIHLWCPPNGIVLDAFAGSGTTGHAVLDLNKDPGASRRFVLIEQGRPDHGDPYAQSLTRERVRRAIAGERVTSTGEVKTDAALAMPGGFRFTRLTGAVDAEAVLALQREEMLDLLLTSHWDQQERSAAHLNRLQPGAHAYLFATSPRGNEGYFLVWTAPDGVPPNFDRTRTG